MSNRKLIVYEENFLYSLIHILTILDYLISPSSHFKRPQSIIPWLAFPIMLVYGLPEQGNWWSDTMLCMTYDRLLGGYVAFIRYTQPQPKMKTNALPCNWRHMTLGELNSIQFVLASWQKIKLASAYIVLLSINPHNSIPIYCIAMWKQCILYVTKSYLSWFKLINFCAISQAIKLITICYFKMFKNMSS